MNVVHHRLAEVFFVIYRGTSRETTLECRNRIPSHQMQLPNPISMIHQFLKSVNQVVGNFKTISDNWAFVRQSDFYLKAELSVD